VHVFQTTRGRGREPESGTASEKGRQGLKEECELVFCLLELRFIELHRSSLVSVECADVETVTVECAADLAWIHKHRVRGYQVE
jgi:hypothetical protein